MNLTLPLQFIPNIVLQRLPVINRRHPIPPPKRIPLLTIQQRQPLPTRSSKAIQAPLPLHNPNLKKHPLLSHILARPRIDRLQMKDPLLRPPHLQRVWPTTSVADLQRVWPTTSVAHLQRVATWNGWPILCSFSAKGGLFAPAGANRTPSPANKTLTSPPASSKNPQPPTLTE